MKTPGNDVQNDAGTKRYRALFVSDLHLGTKACQAEAFLDFLRLTEADRIYLVGDIVDFWRIKRGVYWPQAHNDVLQKLLRKARKGTDLVFIPGNHDEALRDYCGARFGGIAIERNTIHIGADGRRYLVMHGDEFDVVVRYAKWLALFGDWSYMLALWANTHFNAVRRFLGLPYWSLSAYLKQRVKRAVNYIGEFETALAARSAPARGAGRDLRPYPSCRHPPGRRRASISTPATGSKAARRSPRPRTGPSRSSAGRNTRKTRGRSPALVEELEAAA